MQRASPEVDPAELFFDLVMVFGFLQVDALLVEDPHAHGVLVAGALTLFLWRGWVGVSYVTNAAHVPLPFLLPAMGALGAMAVALPQAFTGEALPFAIAYAVLRVVQAVMLGVAVKVTAAPILLSPVVLLVGAVVPASAAGRGQPRSP